jgi:hypothetical protein
MVKCFVWQLAAFVGYHRKIPHVIVMRVLMSKIFGSPLFISPAILFAFAGVRSVGGLVQIEAAVDGDAEVGADIRVVRSVVQEERSDEEGFWFRTSY